MTTGRSARLPSFLRSRKITGTLVGFRHHYTLWGITGCLDDMQALLEGAWQDGVKETDQGVLATATGHVEGNVLGGFVASLAVDGTKVHQRVLEQWRAGAVVVHPEEDRAGATCLSTGGHNHRSAHPSLSVLDHELHPWGRWPWQQAQRC